MKKSICLLILILSLVLTACGGAEGWEVQTPELIDYVVDNRSIALEEVGFIAAYAETPEQFMYIAVEMIGNSEIQKLFLVDKTTLADKKNKTKFSGTALDMEQGMRPNAIFAGNSDEIYVLSTMWLENGRDIFLTSFTKAGEKLETIEITDAVSQAFDLNKETYFQKAVMDDDGKIYILYSNVEQGVCILDSEGAFIGDAPCEEGSLLDIVEVGNAVYVAQTFADSQKKDVLQKVDPEKFKLVQVAEIPDGRGGTSLTAVDEETLLIGDSTGLWKYQISDGSMVQTYEWLSAAVEGREIKDIAVDVDGRVSALLKTQKVPWSQKVVYLQEVSDLVNEEEIPTEKTVVTIGTYKNNDTLLQKTIQKFNLTNKKYTVELKIYDYDSKALETELISGKGPDLIELKFGGFSPAFVAEKGMVEDLTPYLDKSEGLKQEDLKSEVIDLYTIDDTLVAIPPSFGLSATLVGRASELGTEPGWTTEEFLEYVEENRGLTIFEGSSIGDSGEYLAAHYIWSEWENLVDYKEKKANFDNPEFKAVLEYAKGYESKYDIVPGTDGETTEERIKERKVLLYDQGLWDPAGYGRTSDMFEGDMVFIGYPSGDGKEKHGMMAKYAYSINVNAQNKDGAWAFIEYMLLVQEEEVKDDRSGWNHGFSTYVPALEYQFEKAIKKAQYYRGEEVAAEIFEKKKQNIEACRALLDKISFINGEDGTAGDIVFEEIFAYFAGDDSYTADRVIENIQNRVQLYLDEF